MAQEVENCRCSAGNLREQQETLIESVETIDSNIEDRMFLILCICSYYIVILPLP